MNGSICPARALAPSRFSASNSLLASGLLLAGLALTGCSANFAGNPSSGVGAAAGVQTGTIRGSARGGQYPLTNARVYLYSAPATGTVYGGPAHPALVAASNTATDGSTSPDGTTIYYSTTDATTGAFDLSNDYTCAQNDQMYLLVRGGSPGVGANPNPDAALIVALGACSTLNTPRNVTVNELTTVAAVYALQQFMTDATHISASAGDPQGLVNAFTTAQLLVNTGVGVPTPTTSTTSFPTAKIFTLGEVMAHCVNSDPSNASDHACSDFFNAANTNSATGTIHTNAPTDTVQAMLEIAQNPGVNVMSIASMAGTGIVFGSSNELGATVPNDFALPIAYSGPGILQASSVALDADGNAYVNVCARACDAGASGVPDVVAKVTPAGIVTTFGNPTVHNPQAVMVDSDSFNVWNTDIATDIQGSSAVPAVDIFSRTGSLLAQALNPPSPGTPFLSQPEGIAYDPINSVAYVADAALGTLQQVRPSGTAGSALTLSGGTPATSLVAPVGVAIDSNQDIVATDDDPSGAGYVVFTPGSGGTYTGTAFKGSLAQPTALAFDSTHNLWLVDSATTTLYRINYTAPTPSQNAILIANAQIIRGLAIDGGGQALVPSCASAACNGFGSNDALFVLDNNGNPTPADGNATGAYGVQDASLANPVSAAVDESGNVWVTSVNPGAITVFVGLANPVQTPLASSVLAAKLGARP